jgi:predicted transcriptional regulator
MIEDNEATVTAPAAEVRPDEVVAAEAMTNPDTIITEALKGVSPKAKEVYGAFVKFGAMTDDNLVQATGIKKGTASPRRNDLVKAGLVEGVGQVATESGGKSMRWNVVPADRVEEARVAAASRGPRRKAISEYSLEDRVEVVRRLLEMEDVNKAIQNKSGRAWSRARGRRQDEKSSRERERRENAAKLREAEQRGSPTAEYYKLRRALIESGDKVRAVRRLVEEELERRAEGHQRIPVTAWSDVSDLLNDLERDAVECNASIRDVMGVMGDDVIEGTVVEDEIFMELIEGDGRATA